jgi:hypothetical protein
VLFISGRNNLCLYINHLLSQDTKIVRFFCLSIAKDFSVYTLVHLFLSFYLQLYYAYLVFAVFFGNIFQFFSPVFWFTAGACMVGIIMLLSGQLSLNSGTYNILNFRDQFCCWLLFELVCIFCACVIGARLMYRYLHMKNN